MLLQREIVGKFIKYSFAGFISIGIYFLSVYILIERYQWDPVVGSAAAFILMTIVSFLINVRFTFGSSFTHQKLVRFLLVSLIGFVLNFSLIFLIVHILTFHYLIGEFVTIIVIPLVNFLLNYFWTFQTR
nr:GtrA family protein [Lysinibacillus timonensis]